MGGSSRVRSVFVQCARQGRGSRLGGQAQVGCRSSLRRGRGGMMGFAVHLAGGVNQMGRPRQGWGS